jgi:hypothetical protein
LRRLRQFPSHQYFRQLRRKIKKRFRDYAAH